MPISKGPNCFGDVMREHKAGQLHSGKGGKVVKDPKQAKAIASSLCHTEDTINQDCYDEGCGGGCGCKSCDRAQKRKQTYMEFGYSEEAADTVVFGAMPAPLGYPVPALPTNLEAAIAKPKRREKD